MFKPRHPRQGFAGSTEHLVGLLTKAGPILLIMTLTLGCVRAKPPRTVTVPEALGAQQRVFEESAPIQDATSKVSGYPAPTTPFIPTPTPTLSQTLLAVETPTIVPTTALSSPTPTLPPTGDVVHVVKKGETIFSIAEKYDTTVEAIMGKNNLPNPSFIYVNQKLVIPVGYKPSGTPTPYMVEHVVKKGESLAQLARKYRTTLSEIIAENPHVSDPNDLAPGTKLVIRAGTAPALRIHVVCPGQSIFSIARRYGVTAEDLVRVNGLRTPNTIYVGQSLIIPH